jgi:hypothetical protein
MTFILAAGFAGTAAAHELPGTESDLAQAVHHLLSLHHLPALIVLVVGGVVAYRLLRRITE